MGPKKLKSKNPSAKEGCLKGLSMNRPLATEKKSAFFRGNAQRQWQPNPADGGQRLRHGRFV
jgi:hypothetical protein